eukprot:symbB.v1.2.013465.t1/scaffold951.1/size304340/5
MMRFWKKSFTARFVVLTGLVLLLQGHHICLMKMSEVELHKAWNQALSGAMYPSACISSVTDEIDRQPAFCKRSAKSQDSHRQLYRSFGMAQGVSLRVPPDPDTSQ